MEQYITQHIAQMTLHDGDWAKLAEWLLSIPDEHRLDGAEIFDRVLAGLDERRQLLNRLHTSLLQLRLDTRYILFDLEATRRERDDYRDQLRLHLAEHHARG